ncbi:unnamed protein product [Caretta caretta]
MASAQEPERGHATASGSGLRLIKCYSIRRNIGGTGFKKGKDNLYKLPRSSCSFQEWRIGYKCCLGVRSKVQLRWEMYLLDNQRSYLIPMDPKAELNIYILYLYTLYIV